MAVSVSRLTQEIKSITFWKGGGIACSNHRFFCLFVFVVCFFFSLSLFFLFFFNVSFFRFMFISF